MVGVLLTRAWVLGRVFNVNHTKHNRSSWLLRYCADYTWLRKLNNYNYVTNPVYAIETLEKNTKYFQNPQKYFALFKTRNPAYSFLLDIYIKPVVNTRPNLKEVPNNITKPWCLYIYTLSYGRKSQALITLPVDVMKEILEISSCKNVLFP